ncbi:rifin PIR protein, putative [Plasmodium reichenowi]|uniref:Rifin PIR protein, putative n=1 Tax=Plasmodium reichenowi TaxID=5854 RepID=A0A2P9D4Q5_PLARE|nr:rifin PIR protein, putative [Plasmodium reichenowi]
MNVHYINILLFALPLNILVCFPNKNPSITPHHTAKIPISRLLCECELYMPNYDNDPQMKKVMEQFDDRISQRFHEYDDRMVEKRKQCKDQCDKEIQKIILKDKIEKELMDKFATLQTDIQSDAIPTCICEKSLADKMEKGCLRCGYGLGTVAPTVGLIGSVAVDQLTSALTASAITAAKQAGIEAGIQAVIAKIETFFQVMNLDVQWANFIKPSNYSTARGIFDAVKNVVQSCERAGTLKGGNIQVAKSTLNNGVTSFDPYVAAGKQAYTAKFGAVKADELVKVTAQSTQLYNAIGYSVIAIFVIILVMVIIYLILRYRRKKKMKKKLEYIKLLNQ